MSEIQSSFTELFDRGRNGDRASLQAAFNLVFADLRRTANRLLERESTKCSFEATDLVSELFLRFHRLECRVLNREHFLGLAARSMKRYLIDRGRRRSVRRKHAAAHHNVSVEFCPPSIREDTLAVRSAWERLNRLDPLAARALWELKVEGRTVTEVAARLRRPAWRVVDDAAYAAHWMSKSLR